MRLIVLLIGILSSSSFAELAETELRIPKLTGEVAFAVWCGPLEYTIVTYQEGEAVETKIRGEGTWYVFLRDVQGVSEGTRKEISRRFASSVGFFAMVANEYRKRESGMLIAVRAPKTAALREGVRIKLSNCSFVSNPLGLRMSCEQMEHGSRKSDGLKE